MTKHDRLRRLLAAGAPLPLVRRELEWLRRRRCYANR